MDLRDRIDAAPTTPEPRLDSGMGPIRARINCEFPPRQSGGEWRPQEVWNPFLPGQSPVNNYSNQVNPWLDPADSQMRCDTAHHSRAFIEGRSTSRDEGTMTDQDPDSTVRGNGEQNVTQDDVTQEEEAEFNERGNDKEN